MASQCTNSQKFYILISDCKQKCFLVLVRRLRRNHHCAHRSGQQVRTSQQLLPRYVSDTELSRENYISCCIQTIGVSSNIQIQTFTVLHTGIHVSNFQSQIDPHQVEGRIQMSKVSLNVDEREGRNSELYGNGLACDVLGVNAGKVEGLVVATELAEHRPQKDEYQTLFKYQHQQIIISTLTLDQIMSRNTTTNPQAHPKPKETAGKTQKQHTLIDNLNFNEDSLLDADESASFDLRNENYQLKSRCNNLEYEKNKLSISYENTIKELKQKYTLLEKLLAEKNEKQDKNNPSALTELKAQCHYLAEENEQLKKELQSSWEKNRVTPNFNSPEMAEELAALAYLQKPENMAQLQKAYDQAAQQQFNELKQNLNQLQRENTNLKEQQMRMESQKQQTIRRITHETEQHHNNILKFKDKTIEELKQEQISLNLQLNEQKKIVSQLTNAQTDNSLQKNIKIMAAQLREKESRVVELEELASRMEIENNRLKSEKTKQEQECKYFETEKKEVEAKRKLLQEQLFKLENEYSEAKSTWFNEKIEIKKQYNSLKLEQEQQINQLKATLDTKQQENKKLKEAVLALNEELQDNKSNQLLQQQTANTLKQEISTLTAQLDKANNENQANQLALKSKKDNNQPQLLSKLQSLQRQLVRAKQQSKRHQQRSQSLQGEFQLCSNELKHKQQMIQILKIQSEQHLQQRKDLERSIKQLEQRVKEKNTTISHLETEIKNLKFDNQQLEIANDELNDKVNTLNKIKQDVEMINSQLKLEKNNLQKEEKRQQHSPKHLDKRDSKQYSNSKNNSQEVDLLDLQELPPIKSKDKDSQEGREDILDIVKQLKTQNSELQGRIVEVENQLDRRAVDLSIKQEEIKTLRQQTYKPKEINLDPYIQTSKRTQFNAIFFQNKINELQQEVSHIKTLKQKQIQQQKKIIRKQIEQKYFQETKKQHNYMHQLQKQNNHLNSQLTQTQNMIDSLQQQQAEVERENYQLKVELKQQLEEVNQLLQKCKHYETTIQEYQINNNNNSLYAQQYQELKLAYQSVNNQYKQQAQLLQNANSQILKLNNVLMLKENELKSANSYRSSLVSNQSFLSNRADEKDRSLQEMSPFEKQLESDPVKMWTLKKQGATFSRI